MELDLEKSPLKSPINVSSPLSNRIEIKVEDKEEDEDIFEDTIQHEEPKMKRKMSVKEIQDCNTKNKLKDYINEKKRKLDQSRRILELKYEKYKKCNDRWNIGTIVLSSLLTFIESTKLIFKFLHKKSPHLWGLDTKSGAFFFLISSVKVLINFALKHLLELT